jgi:hypothetical protein
MNISLYPNPSKDGKSTIVLDRIPTNSIVQVSVCDILGKQVVADYNAVSNGSIMKLDLQSTALPTGIYLVKVNAGGETKMIRWVVE